MLIPEIKELGSAVQIDAPWLLECLEEKFDDAISMLPEDCVIYGGSVRDLLAGIPIAGDLDIAVPHNQYKKLQTLFSNSMRWIRKTGDMPMPKNYKRPSARIISGVTTYTNLTGEELQLIQARPSKEDTVLGNQLKCNSGVLDIITNVDLTCSAIMMDVFGNVFEILPGAFEDCKNKILTFNEQLNLTEVYKQTIASRIKKLESRGWKNTIDITRFSDDPKPASVKDDGTRSKFSSFF